MENKIKYQIAKIINAGNSFKENPTYDDLIDGIYNSPHKTIYKIPIPIFILGTIESFVIKDLDHANKLLSLLKEVVKDALELSGFELIFTDSDWHDLKILDNPTKWGGIFYQKMMSQKAKTEVRLI